jgi:GNAT superfamily N-acetyltransferase
MTVPNVSDWQVDWFSKWEAVHDDALAVLPQCPEWPSELLRYLYEASSGVRRRLALVSEGGTPIGLIGLRGRGRRWWEPLAQPFAVPAFPGVGKVELAGALLMKLRVPIAVQWWRMPTKPPSEALPVIHDYRSVPHYIMDLQQDLEAYWRDAGHLNTVRRARKRCRDLTFAVNPVLPDGDGVGWVNAQWGEFWDVGSRTVENRTVVGRYLEPRGKHHSLLLLDGERPVAGHTFVVHGEDIVWLSTYRDKSYDEYGVGTRLMDLAFHWASEQGYRTLDLGTTQAYKERWAPLSDRHWVKFELCGPFQYRLLKAEQRVMGGLKSVRDSLKIRTRIRSVRERISRARRRG